MERFIDMNFYDEYFKKTYEEATKYKLKYLQSIVKENTIYKFIQFDEVKTQMIQILVG